MQKWLNLLTQVQKSLVLLILGALPLVFVWNSSELFEFPKMMVVYAVSLTLFLLWVIKSLVLRKLVWESSVFDGINLAFLVTNVLSTLFSMHPFTSIFGYYSRFHGGLASTVAYLVLYYSIIQTWNKNDIKKILVSILIGATAAAAYAFPEHYGISPSCMLITNQASVSCWVQDVQQRVFGTLGQPNWLAALLIMTTPLAFVQTLQSEGKSKKYNWILFTCGLLSSTLLFSVTLFTKSRSGILGITCGVLVFILLATLHLYRKNTLITTGKRFLLEAKTQILLVSLLFIFIWIGTPWTTSFEKKLSQESKVESSVQAPSGPSQDALGGTDSGTIRKIVWKGALAVWKEYPIFGSGLETFAYSYYQQRPLEHNLVSEWNFLYNKAHNEWLNYLATTGTLGFLAFLAFSFYPLVLILKKTLNPGKNMESEFQVVAFAIAAGLSALHISNFFGFSTVAVTVVQYTFHALLALIYKKENVLTPQKPQSFQAKQWVVFSIALITTLFLATKAISFWKADLAFTSGQNIAQQVSLPEGVMLLEEAMYLNPSEPSFSDISSSYYAQLAVFFSQDGDATHSAQAEERALLLSDHTLRLNPFHLNNYKGRIRTLTILGSLDEKYLELAQKTATAAQKLAPTDPLLWYHSGILLEKLQKPEEAKKELTYAVTLKPNYENAWQALAELHEKQQEWPSAYEAFKKTFEHSNSQNVAARDKIELLEASKSSWLQ